MYPPFTNQPHSIENLNARQTAAKDGLYNLSGWLGTLLLLPRPCYMLFASVLRPMPCNSRVPLSSRHIPDESFTLMLKYAKNVIPKKLILHLFCNELQP